MKFLIELALVVTISIIMIYFIIIKPKSLKIMVFLTIIAVLALLAQIYLYITKW